MKYVAISKTNAAHSIMALVDEADVSSAIDSWCTVHPGEYVSHQMISVDQIRQFSGSPTHQNTPTEKLANAGLTPDDLQSFFPHALIGEQP